MHAKFYSELLIVTMQGLTVMIFYCSIIIFIYNCRPIAKMIITANANNTLSFRSWENSHHVGSR